LRQTLATARYRRLRPRASPVQAPADAGVRGAPGGYRPPVSRPPSLDRIRPGGGWVGWRVSTFSKATRSWWPAEPLDEAACGRVVAAADQGFGDWATLKADPSGRVLAGEIGGVAVVVKWPALPRGSRRWIAPFRPGRPRRAFMKARRLVGIGLPAELPLFLARRGPEAFGCYARIPGRPLADCRRDDLAEVFRRVGEVLWRTHRLGWVHSDAKLTNWIVTPAGEPVICDCDGLRRDPLRLRPRRGLERVLRDVRAMPAGDVLERALLEGFSSRG